MEGDESRQRSPNVVTKGTPTGLPTVKSLPAVARLCAGRANSLFLPLGGLVSAPQEVFGPEVGAGEPDTPDDDCNQEIVEIHAESSPPQSPDLTSGAA
jgi:hypothetical protein